MSRKIDIEIMTRLGMLSLLMAQVRSIVDDLRARGHTIEKLPVEVPRPRRQAHHNDIVQIRRYGERPVSTGLRADQRDELSIAIALAYDEWAGRAKLLELRKVELPANAGEHPFDIALAHIVDHYRIGRVGKTPTRGPKPNARVGRTSSAVFTQTGEVEKFCFIAGIFFEGCVLNAVTKVSTEEFMLWQSGQSAERPSQRPLRPCPHPLSYPGAAERAVELFRALRFYARRMGSAWDPGFTPSPLRSKKTSRLSRTAIARIIFGLWRGRRCGLRHPTDPDLRICPYSGECFVFEQKDDVWLQRAHMFMRYVLLRYYTGTRGIDGLNWRWVPSEFAGHVTITVSRNNAFAMPTGDVFRQGQVITNGTKPAPDSWMFQKGAWHCARWIREDSKIFGTGERLPDVPIYRKVKITKAVEDITDEEYTGTAAVFLKEADAQAYKCLPFKMTKEVLAFVGLPFDDLGHSLKRSCLTEMYRGGWSADDIADFSGNDRSTVESSYLMREGPRDYVGEPQRLTPGPPASWRAEMRANFKELGSPLPR